MLFGDIKKSMNFYQKGYLLKEFNIYILQQLQPLWKTTAYISQKMPTITMPGALLAFSAPSHAECVEVDSLMDTTLATKTCSIPWCWPAWQQRTGLISVPFSITITEDTPDVWRLPEDNQAVWTFVSNFWAVEDIAQVDYIKKERPDNDTKGQKLLFILK
jgi:hypothetical protein